MSSSPSSALEKRFELTKRGSTVRKEIVAGLTTFLAMVYSVIVVPNMLSAAGFPAESVFIATCLVAGLGSLLIGFWANAPMAIGCAISLTAFTAFSLVIGQKVSIPVALGAVFLMGVFFTLISATGIRAWILRNLPVGIAHGAGIGIGLFLLLIAANGIGRVHCVSGDDVINWFIVNYRLRKNASERRHFMGDHCYNRRRLNFRSKCHL